MEPLVKTFDHFGGLSPLKVPALPLLFKALTSKVFSTAILNYALLRGYRDISNC